MIILLVAWELLKWLIWLFYDRVTPGSTTRRVRRLQKLRDATTEAIQKEMRARSGNRLEQRARDARTTPTSQVPSPPREVLGTSATSTASTSQEDIGQLRAELLRRLAEAPKQTLDCGVQANAFTDCTPSSQVRVILRYVHEPPEESFYIPGNECYHVYNDCYAFRHKGTLSKVERRRICQYCVNRAKEDPDKSAEYGRDLERAKAYEDLFNTRLTTSGRSVARSSGDVS